MTQRLVDFIPGAAGLVIRLTAAGKAALDGSERFEDVIEHQLCNGWERLYPEDIGVLTEAPILCADVLRSEAGVVLVVGTVYWYPRYEVLDPVAQLLEHGSIVFAAA